MTLAPLVVSCAFQAWLMLCPLPKVQVTVQPVMAEAPATTLTSPWNPPGHWLVMVYVAVQPRGPPVGDWDGEELGERDTDGDGLGDRETDGDGLGEALADRVGLGEPGCPL